MMDQAPIFSQSFALFKDSSKSSASWLYFEGPFVPIAEPQRSKAPMLYLNDFFLSRHQPWLRADRLLSIDSAKLKSVVRKIPRADLKFDWKIADKKNFFENFEKVRRAILRGELEKAVPIAFESAESCLPQQLLIPSLIEKILELSEDSAYRHLKPYVVFYEKRLIVGLTPETLFKSRDGIHFETHALAGTQRPIMSHHEADSSNLLFDENAVSLLSAKTAWEHELVVDGLLADIKFSLGATVQLKERRILKLKHLWHLETPLNFDLDPAMSMNLDFNYLIKVLHPSSALGLFPKNLRTKKLLYEIRENYDTHFFGAPIGYSCNGQTELLVAIRNLYFEREHVMLASGCGITSESDFEDEWSEGQAKRNSVKRMLCQD